MDRRYLLPDSGFARSTCFCHAASGDFDAYPGLSAPMGPAQADRALDDSNLAVRVDHRGACILSALQMVSSGNVMRAILPQAWSSAFRRQLWRVPAQRERGTKRGIVCITLSLALGNYLMFDHTMRCRAGEKNYGDYSDVQ